MSHSNTNRIHPSALIGALLAVVATLVSVIALGSAQGINPGVCHSLSPGDVRIANSGSYVLAQSHEAAALSGDQGCALSGSGETPVGYRLP